jgi:hypothetical protein
MNNLELREWLGLTWADLLVYLALAAVAAMFFFSNGIVDALLATTGILLSLAACPIGMKRNPRLSELANVAKLVSYPLCVALVIGAVVAHYIVVSFWNSHLA